MDDGNKCTCLGLVGGIYEPKIEFVRFKLKFIPSKKYLKLWKHNELSIYTFLLKPTKENIRKRLKKLDKKWLKYAEILHDAKEIKRYPDFPELREKYPKTYEEKLVYKENKISESEFDILFDDLHNPNNYLAWEWNEEDLF